VAGVKGDQAPHHRALYHERGPVQENALTGGLEAGEGVRSEASWPCRPRLGAVYHEMGPYTPNAPDLRGSEASSGRLVDIFGDRLQPTESSSPTGHRITGTLANEGRVSITSLTRGARASFSDRMGERYGHRIFTSGSSQ
jgi:hypothetical protein